MHLISSTVAVLLLCGPVFALLPSLSQRLPQQFDGITAFSLSGNGKHFFACIRKYDAEGEVANATAFRSTVSPNGIAGPLEELYTTDSESSAQLTGLFALSPDGQVAFTTTRYGIVSIRQDNKKQLQFEFYDKWVHRPDVPRASWETPRVVQITSDPKVWFVGYQGPGEVTVQVYKYIAPAKRSQMLLNYTFPHATMMFGRSHSYAYGLAVTGDARRVAVSSYNPTSISVQVQQFDKHGQPQGDTLVLPTGHPWHLGFSKDGSILVVLAENRVLAYHVGRALKGEAPANCLLLNATVAPLEAISESAFQPTMAISNNNKYIVFFVAPSSSPIASPARRAAWVIDPKGVKPAEEVGTLPSVTWNAVYPRYSKGGVWPVNAKWFMVDQGSEGINLYSMKEAGGGNRKIRLRE